MKENLARLTKNGWEFRSRFAERGRLYQKGDGRLLYDPQTDRVMFRYTAPPDEIEKARRQRERCAECYPQGRPYMPGCDFYQTLLISEAIKLGERCFVLDIIDEDQEKKERGETHLTLPDIADKVSEHDRNKVAITPRA